MRIRCHTALKYPSPNPSFPRHPRPLRRQKEELINKIHKNNQVHPRQQDGLKKNCHHKTRFKTFSHNDPLLKTRQLQLSYHSRNSNLAWRKSCSISCGESLVVWTTRMCQLRRCARRKHQTPFEKPRLVGPQQWVFTPGACLGVGTERCVPPQSIRPHLHGDDDQLGGTPRRTKSGHVRSSRRQQSLVPSASACTTACRLGGARPPATFGKTMSRWRSLVGRHPACQPHAHPAVTLSKPGLRSSATPAEPKRN